MKTLTLSVSSIRRYCKQKIVKSMHFSKHGKFTNDYCNPFEKVKIP